MGHSANLSFVETNITKMTMPKGANPQMAAMYKKMSPPPRITKVYISGKKHAIVNPENTTIMDYQTQTNTFIDHKKKTYEIQPAGVWSDKMSEAMEMERMKFSAKYTDLKKTKKINGRTCSLVRRVTNVEMDKVKGQKVKGTVKMTSTDCVLQPAPQAWNDSMAEGKKLYKKLEKKIKKNFKKFDMDSRWATGLVIYSEMKSSFGAQLPEAQAAMMPQNRMIKKVSKISEKPFSPLVFRIPKGYKKVVKK